MPYKVFKGWDTGGEPIYEWACTCSVCRTCSSSCLALIEMINPLFKRSHTIRIEPIPFNLDSTAKESQHG